MPDAGPRPSHRPPRDFTLNTSFLDPSDWAEFGREHTAAAEWLAFRSVLAEAGRLEEASRPLTRRQTRRLKELHAQLADVALALAVC